MPMKLSDYNTMRALVREIAHQLAPVLNRVKRLHAAAERRGITAEQLLRSKLGIPADWTVTQDGKVYDAESNLVGDYAEDLYDCNRLLSALAGLRALVALATNDSEFMARPGVTGQDHWRAFIEPYMDDEQIGWLE